MKLKFIKKAVVFGILGVVAIGNAAFAGGYGGYRLPVKQQPNYIGKLNKSGSANSCVYNQVDLLTNTDRATFWIAKSNKKQYSDDYYFYEDENANMFSYGNISSGYIGMKNYDYSNTEAYVDGWYNFN